MFNTVCSFGRYDDVHSFEFDSLAEFADYAKDVKRHKKSRGSRRPGRNNSMYTFDTFEEAHLGAISGWEEGRNRISELLEGVVLAVGTLVHPKKKFWEVEGEILDEDKFMRGEPECMIIQREDRTRHIKTKTKKGRMLDIVLDIGALGGVSARTKEMRGATMLALVDALEMNGFRCRVRALYTNRGDGENSLRILVNLKEPEQRMDLDTLAYAFVAADGHRRHGWSVLESLPFFEKITHTYGNSYLPPGSRKDALMPDNDIEVPCADDWEHNVGNNMKACAKWLIDKLEEQGIMLD